MHTLTPAVRIASALLFLVAAGAAGAQAREIKASASAPYLTDARQVVVMDPFGLCWRTGAWSPAAAEAGGPDGAGCQCDKDILPKAVCEPPKPVVAQAPSPPAPPPPPPAPAAPKTCNFTAVISPYPFGSPLLTDQEEAQIDTAVLPRLADCASISIILVQGYTDRLGSQEYNQKLSEKRAGQVVAYMKRHGVTAEFDAMGMGKTLSVKSCPDPDPKGEIKTRAELIECLAPNRRTVIEVKGLAK